MAHRDGSVSDFHVAQRPLPTLDAGEEVEFVAPPRIPDVGRSRPTEVHLAATERLLDDLVRPTLEMAAIHLNRPVASDELRPPTADMAAEDGHAVGVDVAQPLVILARRMDFDRPGVVHPQSPLGDVEMVSPPVGHGSARVVAPPAPVDRVNLAVVRAIRSRADPHIPVHVIRRGLGRQVARFARAPDVYLDRVHLADSAATDQLACQTKVVRRPLLAADLEDPGIPPRIVHHRPPFAHGQRQRLFAIDVLACLASVDADQRMPVVGHGDEHRIEVLAVEQFAEVPVRLATARHPRRPVGQKLGVRIAKSDRPNRRILHDHLEMVAAHPVDADVPEVEPIVGAGPTRRGQRIAGQHVRSREPRRGRSSRPLEPRSPS